MVPRVGSTQLNLTTFSRSWGSGSASSARPRQCSAANNRAIARGVGLVRWVRQHDSTAWGVYYDRVHETHDRQP